ncbi:G-protein-signaling modulator 2 isoform X2 [Hydra vulgaris]|uniref:G-protein-signaling modulator 2 isoform X2 n=1 Tax=Hydra vulgaris TaxID=6087 RepID=A0ABM4BBC8_HYDVU
MASNGAIRKTIDISNASCMELALQGEQYCKNGDCKSGVEYFEAAIKVGTEDLKTLSAVYSQLGNAYFYLQEYEKALEYHKHDLTLARTLGDRVGEAKASGNLGNTLKVLGKFDEAVLCCTRHLDTARELKDKVSEGRALYNLGNIYHAKGKHLGRIRNRDPGDYPIDVQQALERAIEFYEANLAIVSSLGDRAAEGRAFGNLGNTHYLLGNFEKAVQFHEERLLVAREFNDKAAERRAFSNLGNAHVFLGEFEIAVEYYKKTRELAVELQDKAIQAQACYSLGNTYTLLKKYESAIEYHLLHLQFAQELNDRVGEGRAYWSLGNAHTCMENHKVALSFAKKHLEVSKEVGDRTGELTAEMNIVDLKTLLGKSSRSRPLSTPLTSNEVQQLFNHNDKKSEISTESKHVRLKNYKVTKLNGSKADGPGEDFFDLLYKSQSSRLDDQRCDFPKNRSEFVTKPLVHKALSDSMSSFGDRTELQRNSLPDLPGLSENAKEKLVGKFNGIPDENFLEMLMRCQAARIDDQRCEFPVTPRGPTVPDEDFFNLIARLQSGRMESQRANFNP